MHGQQLREEVVRRSTTLLPEHFFGRSSNRRGTKTEGLFDECPWRCEGEFGLFCYECHEELLHNPVMLLKI